MRMRFKGKDRDAFFGFFIPQVGEAHLLGSGVVVLLLLALYPEVQETVLAHLSRRPKLWLGVEDWNCVVVSSLFVLARINSLFAEMIEFL